MSHWDSLRQVQTVSLSQWRLCFVPQTKTTCLKCLSEGQCLFLTKIRCSFGAIRGIIAPWCLIWPGQMNSVKSLTCLTVSVTPISERNDRLSVSKRPFAFQTKRLGLVKFAKFNWMRILDRVPHNIDDRRRNLLTMHHEIEFKEKNTTSQRFLLLPNVNFAGNFPVRS
jgi:hypothetical protein